MTEHNTTQQELTAQLAEITETRQREKVEFSPEMKQKFDENLTKLNNKLVEGKPIYKKDIEFIDVLKKWLETEIFYNNLRKRFNENIKLHLGVDWKDVEASLRNNPEALWSINEMEKAGHEPDVFNYDKNGFYIGTCSKESPKSGINCTYEEAEEMANALKIELMDQDDYTVNLQRKGEFDLKIGCWIKSPLGLRIKGQARTGRLDEVQGVIVKLQDINSRSKKRSWRGSLRVPWKK